jgi:hypothetical protein
MLYVLGEVAGVRVYVPLIAPSARIGTDATLKLPPTPEELTVAVALALQVMGFDSPSDVSEQDDELILKFPGVEPGAPVPENWIVSETTVLAACAGLAPTKPMINMAVPAAITVPRSRNLVMRTTSRLG